MKKIMLALLIAATTICANAQDTAKAKKNPEERVAQIGITLQKKLHLSADQSTKVNAILAGRAGKIKALQGQKGAKGERVKIMADADSQLEALLTEPQKKLYIQMRAFNKEKNMAQKGKRIPATTASPAS